MDPARLLREARRRAALTQRQLADKAGVPQPTVARIERGTTVPRVDTLDKLLEACGEGLYALKRTGVGVERVHIREQLRLTPEERIMHDQRATQELYEMRSAFRATKGLVAEQPPAYVPSLIDTLMRHGVRFIIVGGVAGNLHGAMLTTTDFDVCYARDPDNLECLAGALREMNAYLAGAPEGLPFQLDARTLANGLNFTFTTDAGRLDCLGEPAGVDGFAELERGAEEVRYRGRTVLVCSLADLIRMKRAAGRPKDLLALEQLGALQEEIDRAQREQRGD